MPNYNENNQPISGTVNSWTRAKQVVVYNPYGITPKIVFIEENVTKYPDGYTTKREGRNITELFDDPTKEFNILNPDTGEVVSAAKYADVYAMLYSLYMALVLEADNV